MSTRTFHFSGPYLPFELEYAAAVTGGGDNEVVLVGGKTRSGKNRDSVLRLHKNKWQVLKTTLEVARSSHGAILVPDSLFNC